MFKPGDSLTLTNKPTDIPEDWTILSCHYNRMSRPNTMVVVMVILIGNSVEGMTWTFDVNYCKPLLKTLSKTNFKFGRGHAKI